MIQLTPVTQQEPTGCGIACVAMLAGTSYEKVRVTANRLGISAKDERLWSETGYARRLLHEFGIETAAAEIPFTGWDSLPDLALLAIKYHLEQGRPRWHWVVFSRREGKPLVLDPALDLKHAERTDFAAMQPRWFIRIEPPNHRSA